MEEQKTSSFLKIEGVNLAHSIFDTEDLSTRRGGSLMLLKIINEIERRNGAHLRRISTGASAGLFGITGDAKAAIADIESLLRKEPYCYGTFVLDVMPADGRAFPALERAAVAANRWRQMRSLSFSPVGLRGGNGEVCEVDEVRPALEREDSKGESRQLGASVRARRKAGVEAKQRFYPGILGTHYASLRFTDDFEEISTKPRERLRPASLEGKLAVFYADGNDFGKIARGCNDEGELKDWDDYIKGQRKSLLAALLDHAVSKDHWLTKAGQLRLETLLWGGDELMFTVPGWCGMELAKLIIEHTQGMRYPDNDGGKTLFHACGLVFCHHQAPISRITSLAMALAAKGKMADRSVNSLNWLVLESFDHTGSGLDDYLQRRLGPGMPWSDLALNSDALSAMIEDFPTLREQLPRSAIVRITRALAERRAFDAEGDEMPLIERARKQVADAGGDAFKRLWPRLHPKEQPWVDNALSCDDLGAWLKLAELWDYCPDWSASATRTGAQQ